MIHKFIWSQRYISFHNSHVFISFHDCYLFHVTNKQCSLKNCHFVNSIIVRMYFSNFLHLQGTFVASTKINRSTTAFHTFKYVIQSCIHARTLTRSPNVDAKGTNLVSRLLYACHELDRIADRLDGRYFHTKIEQSTIQTLHCFSHHNTLQSFFAVQSVFVAKRKCKTKSNDTGGIWSHANEDNGLNFAP